MDEVSFISPGGRDAAVFFLYSLFMESIEITFADAFPDVCPKSLLQLKAGFIREGMFYPSGSVAEHYFKCQQKTRKQEKLKPHVYFIQAENGGPVKIGHAVDVDARIDQLQTGNPYRLKVIGLIKEGGASVEKKLHERFKDCRLVGEWFSLTPELESVIRETGTNNDQVV